MKLGALIMCALNPKRISDDRYTKGFDSGGRNKNNPDQVYIPVADRPDFAWAKYAVMELEAKGLDLNTPVSPKRPEGLVIEEYAPPPVTVLRKRNVRSRRSATKATEVRQEVAGVSAAAGASGGDVGGDKLSPRSMQTFEEQVAAMENAQTLKRETLSQQTLTLLPPLGPAFEPRTSGEPNAEASAEKGTGGGKGKSKQREWTEEEGPQVRELGALQKAYELANELGRLSTATAMAETREIAELQAMSTEVADIRSRVEKVQATLGERMEKVGTARQGHVAQSEAVVVEMAQLNERIFVARAVLGLAEGDGDVEM